jgi:Uma2 family endonuclease
VQLREDSEPEPDLALLASEGPPGQHPAPDDILLIIEVADTSLEHDRDTKLPLYAAAGIPEYWLVNLADRSVDVYREPDGATYARRTRHRADDSLQVAAFPDLGALPVGDVFPEHISGDEDISGDADM